ncbi:MAG: tetratricopeptide repeat protein [Bacteroidota bacterium]
MMTTKQKIQWGIAVLLLVASAVILVFRNMPEMTVIPPEEKTTSAPPVMEVPSKANVTPSFTEQVDKLKQSVAKNPSNAAHMISLAQLLMDGHQNKEAVKYFEKAALLQPKNDSLLLDLAVCYFNEKDYSRALGITEQILSFNKTHSRALYNKGAILMTLNKKDEAVKVWKKLVKVAPNSEEAKTVSGHLPALEKP